MAIFPLIETEPIIQVNDKTRLNCIKSFVSKDEPAVTLVELEPNTGDGYINITGSAPINSKNWYLDWSYSTDGTKTVNLRITTSGAPVIFSKTLTVITEANDKLWSSDSDLIAIEPDIMNWVRPGRATFLDYHRMSQTRILEWLDNLKIWNKDGEKFTKDDINLVMAYDDLKRISSYWALELIFGGLSNKTDDVFNEKMKQYRNSRRELCGDRSRIRADYDKSGTVTSSEQFQIKHIRMNR